MNKYKISWLLCLIITIPAFGQITSEQLKLIEQYKKDNAGMPVDEIESFKSPEIFQSEPEQKDERLNEKSEQPAPKREEELTLFGHDIFGAEGTGFNPDIYDLPPEGYILGPGDNLLINVWGRVDLEYNLTIDREGSVFIPKAGEMIIAGKTIDSFKSALHEKLATVYSDFQLSVTYGKLRRISIYVFGEVINPGGYTISSLADILHALYTAGGITEQGGLRNIQLVRHNKITETFDLYDLLLRGDYNRGIKLMSGDVVYVPVTGPQVAVSGEVRRPAIYELRGDETVMDVIELAGGTNPEAHLESVSLDRVGPKDSRMLLDINLAELNDQDSANAMLQDGDRLMVHSIYDFHTNQVYLEGHVKHPGKFGITDSMRVNDLVADGQQLKENTYFERADLFRMNDDGSRTIIPINLRLALENSEEYNLLLEPYDSLIVHSNEEVTREKQVRIEGEIKWPGSYKFYENMKLSDLIFLAGNLTKQAYLTQCEIARETGGPISNMIQVDLKKALSKDSPDTDILLAEDDVVFIRPIPEWKPVRTVYIEGEVKYPGSYAISDICRTLGDLIHAAGGLTNLAFPEGALFWRKSIQEDLERRNIKQIINNVREIQNDSLGRIIVDNNVIYEPENLNRIIVHLPEVLRNPQSSFNINLADSDYVYVPTFPSGVQVIGAVASNGTIAFASNKKANYYIDKAGGITPNSDLSEMRLVTPYGKVLYGRQARGKKIELGDAVIVPTKIKRRTDWGRIITTTATVLGTLATTALVIDRLGN